jgi:C1A family cysteine protease
VSSKDINFGMKHKEVLSNKRTNKYLGWIPDLPDTRDYKYNAPVHIIKKLPPSVDLREKCPDVYNQGELGSCTANSIAGAIEFDLLKQGLADFVPSRLFIYYNERVMEGTINSDAGAMIRDGVKSVNKQGVCDENEWVYDISKFTERPTDTVYQQALGNVALEYQRVPRDLDQMKTILASGYPFVIGFSVYSHFESREMAQNGMLALPAQDETILGGHAVLVVGYDDSKNSFIVRNSWGKDWGLDGYFYMDYNYLLNPNLSDDFWYIKKVK